MQNIPIHLYALCWNDVRMLPFFFHHYDDLVERYFIFDNGSTDGSLDMLRKHPKVVLGSFEVHGDSFVEAARLFYNDCWKPSRGNAAWVIVCNIDEHLHHPDFPAYLASLPSDTSLIIPEGYSMVADVFPVSGTRLYEQIRNGVRRPGADKPEMFSPNLIDEINFGPGRHVANPTGAVKTPPHVEVKLLHFKFMGIDYYAARNLELRSGMRSGDIEQGLGQHYSMTEQEKADRFAEFKQEARPVL